MVSSISTSLVLQVIKIGSLSILCRRSGLPDFILWNESRNPQQWNWLPIVRLKNIWTLLLSICHYTLPQMIWNKTSKMWLKCRLYTLIQKVSQKYCIYILEVAAILWKIPPFSVAQKYFKIDWNALSYLSTFQDTRADKRPGVVFRRWIDIWQLFNRCELYEVQGHFNASEGSHH